MDAFCLLCLEVRIGLGVRSESCSVLSLPTRFGGLAIPMLAQLAPAEFAALVCLLLSKSDVATLIGPLTESQQISSSDVSSIGLSQLLLSAPRTCTAPMSRELEIVEEKPEHTQGTDPNGRL